jgi:hypothetical protein
LGFFVFDDHSSHLGVEFTIYLWLHALIHGLHELLDYVFDVLEVGISKYLLLEIVMKIIYWLVIFSVLLIIIFILLSIFYLFKYL